MEERGGRREVERRRRGAEEGGVSREGEAG